MIIITGSGRSGTSVLAELYKELGFNPGGKWHADVSAGMERGDFWRLNNALATELGMTMLHPLKEPRPPRSASAVLVRRVRRRAGAVRARLLDPTRTASPPDANRSGESGAGSTPAAGAAASDSRGAAASDSRGAAAPGSKGANGTYPADAVPAGSAQRLKGRVRLADWDRFDEVVARNRDRLVELATSTRVVKDPRFIYLLPVWLAAGAPIEFAVITMRPLPAVIASRHLAGQTEFGGSDLRNSLTYGMGLALAAVYEYDLPHTFVRFPDFLHDPDGLYAALRFPAPVSFDRFREVAARVFDPTQVHHGAPRPASC